MPFLSGPRGDTLDLLHIFRLVSLNKEVQDIDRLQTSFSSDDGLCDSNSQQVSCRRLIGIKKKKN